MSSRPSTRVPRLAALLALAVAALLRAGEPASLRLIKTIPLPNTPGRFDHFAIDVAGQRLFLAALGHDSLEVFNLANLTRAKSIARLSKPQGVLYLADPGRCYVANGDDGTLRTFDGKTLSVLANIGALDDADNLRCDAKAQRIYVGFGDGALGLTDVSATQLLGKIALKGHPEAFQLEGSGPRIFVNVPAARMIAVVDRQTRAVVAEWPMSKFQANFPMALDDATQRLFVGCRRPARLVVFDTRAGAPIADLEISGDTDDLFFDAKRQRLYVACGEGCIDIIERRDGDRYRRIDRVATRAGARTGFFSPDLDRLFVAVPQRDGHEAELRVFQPN